MLKTRAINSIIGASLFSVATLASAATTVSGGTVHFTGQIVNAACAISADSMNQTVNMGQFRTARFKAVGDRSGDVPFQIKLLDCDTSVSTKASATFVGAADATDATVLSVSNISGGGAGSASGLGIELTDSKGLVLTPNGVVFSTPATLTDGANVLNFNARYKSTKASVLPGQADADATFKIKYE